MVVVCFRSQSTRPCSATISFNGTVLCYLDYVTHLGHIITWDLSDHMDMIRVIRDMNRKVNSILCTFGSVDLSRNGWSAAEISPGDQMWRAINVPPGP